VDQTSNEDMTTYIAAKLRAPDDLLGSDAQWAYTDYDGSFRIAATTAAGARPLLARLRRAGMLFGPDGPRRQVYPTLVSAVRHAEDWAGPYEAQGRVD
jgi:hypothetical protein